MNKPLDNLNLLVRPMLEADLPSVLKIEKAIYAYPWTHGNFFDCLASGYRCYVLICDGKLIAYAVQMTILDEMHLLNLTVAAVFQKKGVGRYLLESLVSDAISFQAVKMILEVRRFNYAAIFLYESLNFEQIGLRKNYYQTRDGREDAIVMEMSL